MRVLRNHTFRGVEPFVLGDSLSAAESHPACVSEVILHTLERYRPFPSRTLGISGLRSFNKLCLAFADEKEAYTLQEEEFETLLKVAEWTLPRCPWFRQAPAIMDLLLAIEEQ